MIESTLRTRRAVSTLLRPFAKVEPEEATTALVMTVTVFLLLTDYHLLKTAREPLILLHGGAEVKSSAGQAVLLLVFVQAYGGVARRVGRMKLLLGVMPGSDRHLSHSAGNRSTNLVAFSGGSSSRWAPR